MRARPHWSLHVADRRASRLDRPAIREERLQGSFSAWRGLSGRRHVVMVTTLDAAPDQAGDCCAIAVRRDAAGLAHIVAVSVGGCSPAWCAAVRDAGANELHLHRLADSAAARLAVMEDLTR